MKKNILLKVLFITLVFILLISAFYKVSADFIPGNYEPDKLERGDAEEVFNIGEKIYGAAKNIATIVAILTIAVIGLKYMFGSIEQKAEYKTTLVPWFIGAILVVVITRLLGIIEELAGHII